MGIVKKIRGFTPLIGEDTFLAETSLIIGDVIIGDKCSIWYHSVIRGDVNSIRIGNRVNVQDLVMIHATFEKASTSIGNDVSIGHCAIVHGCKIEDNVLIGMGAIVMDLAIVESNSIIAAGALIKEKTIVKSGEVWAGIPAKKVKEVNEDLSRNEIKRIAKAYLKYSSWYKE